MTGRNTANNSQTRKQGGKGKPFVKGDARINRKGRPKSFDALRKLAQSIAHEPVIKVMDRKPLVYDGHIVTTAEAILRSWATSTDVRKQQLFIEYSYGKVPQTNTDLQIDLSKLTDEQLARLAKGDDLFTILTDKGSGSA